MQIAKPLLLLLPIYFIVGFSNCISADAKENKVPTSSRSINVIQVTQKHFYYGNVCLTLSEKGIRLDGDPKQKWIVVAKPPDWNVTVYRMDDKTCFEQDMKKFLTSGLVSGMFMKYRPRFVLKKMTPTTFNFHGFNSYHQADDDACFEFTPLDQSTPKEIEPLIYSFYRLPTGGGLPLTYVALAKNQDILLLKSDPNNHRKFLTTSTITRKSVDSHIFDVPDGLRRAKYVGEIMVNEAARKQGPDLNSLLDSPLNKQ